jgi:hypothetical protein
MAVRGRSTAPRRHQDDGTDPAVLARDSLRADAERVARAERVLAAVELSGLRPKHRRFVQEYWRNRCNATKAYQLAGYDGLGHTAEVNASRIARRPDVAAAIAALRL